MYSMHKSEQLRSLYKSKPYQCQNPEKATVIFFGLDANFQENLEETAYYKYIEEYLEDGVVFWEKYNVHHPFLLPEYPIGDGVTYHKRFSKLQLNYTHAKYISFVELLDIPTIGNTGSNKKEFRKLINIDYLKNLESIVLNPQEKKLVFISKSVLNELLNIKRKYDIFTWLPDTKVKGANKAHKLFESEAICLYLITHFSSAISNEHIAEIREIMNRYLPNEVNFGLETRGSIHYDNSLQLALAICIKIIDDLSNTTDVRLYTWWKEPGNYYLTLYPAVFMDTYDLNNVEEETKLIDNTINDFINSVTDIETKQGLTIGLYSEDSLMIPWCMDNTNYFKIYQENKDFNKVYEQVIKSINIEELKRYSKCRKFDNSKHIGLLKEIFRTIRNSPDAYFHLPCHESAFPFETVRFSNDSEDICEFELDVPYKIKTLAKNGRVIYFMEEGQSKFLDLETGEIENTEVIAASVITKYYFDIYEKEYLSVEELVTEEKKIFCR